ncbi:hypothetical protein Ocin01_18615 [Orchesella cincta]|uniref:Cubilin n=1 Tax=Orchesella cincta TaxID=48709 RepID=A0A1D2M503_ORCCI|nr:hypothetical protein Ocin01_18615 [Orchesella cincta]
MSVTECGQTLLADDGVIEYKLNQTYDAGELCTFVIKIEWFSGATFTLERNGFNPAGQDAVAVFPLHTGSPQTPSYFGPNSASRLSFPQSTFFVVFRTTTNNGTGFRLSFKHENSASWAIPGPARVFNNDSSMPLELPFPSGLVVWKRPGAKITECGQTLLGDEGVIEYKLNQTYEAGELCTFIVKIYAYYGATFTLESNGFNRAGQDAVAVIPAGSASPIYFGPNSASRFSFEQSTFFIVFSTTTNNGTGFRLSFKHENRPGIALPGPALVYNNDSSAPLEFPFPSNYVISTHPVALTSGAKLLEGNSTLELTVAENFVAADDCSDYVDIISYNGGEALYLGKLCGRDEEPKVFNTQGIFMIVYVSNNAIDTNPPQASLTWKTIN